MQDDKKAAPPDRNPAPCSPKTEAQNPRHSTPQLQRLELLGEMTGGIAHNFNNLLTVVLGNIDRLRDRNLSWAARDEAIRMIDDAARRGAALTEHIVSFAHAEPLTLVPVDLCAFIEATLPMWHNLLPPGVRLEFRHDGDLWPVKTDRDQLEAAILNLVINASDAMPDGGELVIEARNIAPGSANLTAGALSDTHHVMLTVLDTGHGMPAEVLRAAFEPFFTTKPSGKGTGLGLSSAYAFMRQAGGDITLASTPGEGARVALFIPTAERCPLPDPAPQKQSLFTDGSHTVLVVDDDPLVRAYVRSLLTSLSYKVITASNGEEALDMLRTDSKVDLLFSDVQMHGGMNGYELVREATALYPGLAVLLTSGYPEADLGSANDHSSAPALLRKPYRARALSVAVHSAISGDQVSEVRD